MPTELSLTHLLANQIEKASKVRPLLDHHDQPTVELLMRYASKHSENGIGKPDICLQVDSHLIIIEVKHGLDKQVQLPIGNPASCGYRVKQTAVAIRGKAENGAFNYLVKSNGSDVDFASVGVKDIFYMGISLADNMDTIGRNYILDVDSHSWLRLPSFDSTPNYFTRKNLDMVSHRAENIFALKDGMLDEEISLFKTYFRKLTGKDLKDYYIELTLLLIAKLHPHFESRIRDCECNIFDVVEFGMDLLMNHCRSMNGNAVDAMRSFFDFYMNQIREIPINKLSDYIDRELAMPASIYYRFWADMFHHEELVRGRMIRSILPPKPEKRLFDISEGCSLTSIGTINEWAGGYESKLVGEKLIVLGGMDTFPPVKVWAMLLGGMDYINIDNHHSRHKKKAASVVGDMISGKDPEDSLISISLSNRYLTDDGHMVVAVEPRCVDDIGFENERKEIDEDCTLELAVRMPNYYLLRFRKGSEGDKRKVTMMDLSNRKSEQVLIDKLKKLPPSDCYVCDLPVGIWFTKNYAVTPKVSKTNPTKKTTSTKKPSSTRKGSSTKKVPSSTKKTPTKKPASTGRKTSTAKTAGTTKKATTSTRKTSTSTKNTKAGKTTTRK